MNWVGPDVPAASTPAPATSSRAFAPGSPERASVAAAIAEVRSTNWDVPTIIGGLEVRTGRLHPIVEPHDQHPELGRFHQAGPDEVLAAIAAARATHRGWSTLPFELRAEPFRRAADLLEFGPARDRLVAAAMVELSKTSAQAEGDVAEAVDFLRANLANAQAMMSVQPVCTPGVTNHLDYRPLEGFVLAVTPFNFVSMNNLALAPALLGNTVLWKPAESASLVAHLTAELLREAGLPDGVLNVLHGEGAEIGGVALPHRDLAGVAFTGSTSTFQHIWQTVGANITGYRNYPRVVGETGGKDFVLAHPSADLEPLAVACVRAAYEYQGQKCAAASRLYVPRSLWPALRERLVNLIGTLRMGDPTVPGTYLGAVINARQFAKHEAALARAAEEGLVLAGGRTDDSTGWFVEPTLLEVIDPQSPFLTEELFAPVLAAYVYDDGAWDEVLSLVDGTSEYGLTGSVFATDERALAQADATLRYAAGNFYLNDKPSGAAVGQQPFGGARASGTNDKTGTVWHLSRFVSPRAVKRNHQPPRDLRSPDLEA
ncbi:L-glutamate gamma-semialdehyde dehydrogenase [Ornithinimicrobium cavernae]|uniref:L-glutamate gamma-semialdehyde dehydrogenase n=1 Tax=Ornithinimicrobium cavernae TaxID=2666047 RepID=UPI000D69AF1F|nr:L-glutamate gamma-semialdehyde dehydrogenase [Ornithinimicrobium cavernae]